MFRRSPLARNPPVLARNPTGQGRFWGWRRLSRPQRRPITVQSLHPGMHNCPSCRIIIRIMSRTRNVLIPFWHPLGNGSPLRFIVPLSFDMSVPHPWESGVICGFCPVPLTPCLRILQATEGFLPIDREYERRQNCQPYHSTEPRVPKEDVSLWINGF